MGAPTATATAAGDIEPSVDPAIGEVPRSLAACSTLTGELTRVFFSDELHDIARAKHICATCPVMADCLEGALTRREPWGVWGGQLIRNGRIVLSKRRRGRPSSTPRPEDQLPLIPIPERLRSSGLLRAV